MKHHRPIRLATGLLVGAVFAFGLVLVACSDSPSNPVAPSSPSTSGQQQTLTITANGVFPSLTYITPGNPLMIVNNDTKSHQLHLDVEDQPGCSSFDLAGEIPPGESRLTGNISTEARGCDVHDHMSHGDARFSVQLVVDIEG